MSEARKKLTKETDLEKKGYKLYRPEMTVEQLIEAKHHGLLVKRAQPFSLAKGEKPMYTIGKSTADVDRYLVSVSNVDHVSIEELERRLREVDGQEEKTKEEIKRKREELRLNKEENLIKFRNGVRHMIDDEKSGIIHYEELIVKADVLRYEKPTPIIFELKKILDEERRHLNTLKEMMNWK